MKSKHYFLFAGILLAITFTWAMYNTTGFSPLILTPSIAFLFIYGVAKIDWIDK